MGATPAPTSLKQRKPPLPQSRARGAPPAHKWKSAHNTNGLNANAQTFRPAPAARPNNRPHAIEIKPSRQKPCVDVFGKQWYPKLGGDIWQLRKPEYPCVITDIHKPGNENKT